MNHSLVLKLAGTSAVLALVGVGCTPATKVRPLASSGTVAPKGAPGAAQFAAAAMAALGSRSGAEAVGHAEAAVAIAPANAEYRSLLAQSYLSAGRFTSAEAAFRDVIALDPANGRAWLSLALSQIALGRQLTARSTLQSARAMAPETDVGLAFALAGEKQIAVELLEAAARAPGASAKTRQNLALAYGLAGQWDKAKATAEIDLAPAEVDQRIREWATFANPATPYDQVASLLGVAPVIDPGQPERLALAPRAAEPALASAESSVTVAVDPVQTAEAQPIVPPAEAVAPVAPVELAAAVPPPAPAPAVEAPTAVVTAPIEAAAAEYVPVRPIPYRIPTEVAQMQLMRPASKPAPAAEVAAAEVAPLVAKPVVPQQSGGRYVVQLGAFTSAGRVEAAWGSVSSRVARLAGYTPSSAAFTLPSRVTLHRLSIAGIVRREDAVRLCAQVRGAGGSCFVRQVAGDAPIQWVKRKVGTQLASR